MSKTTNKFSPEVRERALRLVVDNEGRHGSHVHVTEKDAVVVVDVGGFLGISSKPVLVPVAERFVSACQIDLGEGCYQVFQ